MDMTEETRMNENNAIIDHLEAVRRIIKEVCGDGVEV